MAKATSPILARPKLKLTKTQELEELQKKQDSANESFAKRDEEIQASYDADDAVKAEIAEEILMTQEELAEQTAKLEADLEKKEAENKELDERTAEAEHLAKVVKETQAADSAFQTQAPQTLFKEPEVTTRVEREQMNMKPDFYKQMNSEFVSSIQNQVRGNVLSTEDQKAFRSESQKILQAIDSKTVSLRDGNLAMERPEGSSQVVTKSAVDLLRKGDTASVTAMISQMQQRGSRLIYEHEMRIKTLEERADLYRSEGDLEKASFYEKKIEHEVAAYDRDTALNYLAQREYIDADRGETEALKEQRQVVAELREKADLLYAQVEQMEEFENAKEISRDITSDEQEAFEKETAELDEDFENDFDDLKHELSEEREREQNSEIDDDLYAAEAAAEEAEAARLKALQEDNDAELHDDEDTSDQAIRKLEEETERHNESVELERAEAQSNADSPVEAESETDQNDQDDAQGEVDIYAIPDEDTRSLEDMEQETDKEVEFENPKYDMKSGKIALEQDEENADDVTSVAEVETAQQESAEEQEVVEQLDTEPVYEYQDYPIEIDENEPVFEDDAVEVVEMDDPQIEVERSPSVNDQGEYVIEEIESVSEQDAQTSEADIDQLVSERQDTIQDEVVAEQVVTTESVGQDAEQLEVKAEVEDRTHAQADEDKTKVETNDHSQQENVDGTKDAQSDVVNHTQSSQKDVGAYDKDKAENTSDKGFRDSFDARMTAAENDVSRAEASGDHKQIAEARDRQREVCDEYNSYMNDRQSLTQNKSDLREKAQDFSSATNTEDREQAKHDYVAKLNDTANQINNASDKPWGKSMAQELTNDYKDQMTAMKKENPSDASELSQAVKDSRDPDRSATVRVTRADVEMTRQQMTQQAQTQRQTDQESQSQSAA